MSLSTIAHVIQNLDSETPIKLADKMMDANKKKKKQRKQIYNPASNTYTLLPTDRASLPASTTKTESTEKLERGVSQSFLKKKLSLGNQNNELDSKSFDELLSQVNINSNLDDLLDTQFESKTEDFFADSQNLKS